MNFIAQIADFQLWSCMSDGRFYLSFEGADGYFGQFRMIGEAVCYIGKQLDKVYVDTESGNGITRYVLYEEWRQDFDNIRSSSGAKSFHEYLRNATSKNGFLEEMK